jgi:cytochrome c oxidase subunit I
MAAIDR